MMDLSGFDDTIAAPATIPGTGAITVIRVSGTLCFKIIDKVVKFSHGTASEALASTVKHGNIFSEDGSEIDEVLVSVFRAPRSYTGEDSAEVSCHASSFIASEVLRLLCDAGARPAGPGEFTRRAFVNGKMDLAQAEAVADVISSTGEASLKVAMNQLRGGYSKDLMNIRAQLLEMTSLLELELDFSEEDVEFADRSRLTALLDTALSHIDRLTDSFRYGNALRNGVPVAIVGAVNSGKSTLLNALLGDDRAIVSDVAGTTRDTIEETMTLGGVLFRFIDTAGLRETSDKVEKIGISRSYRKLSEASIVLALLDVSALLPAPEAAFDNDSSSNSNNSNEAKTQSADEFDLSLISDIVTKIDFGSQKLAILLNKADLLADSEAFFDDNKSVSIRNKIVSLAKNKAVIFFVSAKTGFGLERLKSWLADSQKDLTSDPDQTIVTNLRHYSALCNAAEALSAVKSALASGQPTDLLAEDLRQANYHLGTIFGEVTPDEVLGEIFGHFCVGK